MADFLLSCPISVLLQALSVEDDRSTYSDLGVRISLYVDLEKGKMKSLSSYARIWGWHKGTLNKRWLDITRDLWLWCSSNERQSDPEKNPLAARYFKHILPLSKKSFCPGIGPQSDADQEETPRKRVGNELETKNCDFEPESTSEETPRKRVGNGLETHTIHSVYTPINNNITTGDFSQTGSGKAPCSVRECEIYFEGRKADDPASMADDFWHYWDAMDWMAKDPKTRKGVSITASSWRRRASTWFRLSKDKYPSTRKNGIRNDKQGPTGNEARENIFRLITDTEGDATCDPDEIVVSYSGASRVDRG